MAGFSYTPHKANLSGDTKITGMIELTVMEGNEENLYYALNGNQFTNSFAPVKAAA